MFECAALLIAELLDVFDFIAFEAVFEADLLASLAIELALVATELAVLAIELAAFAMVLAAFAVALLAVLAAVFVVSPPQAAIPKALNAKSVESAITFFIIELILLSSSKIKFTYFYSRPRVNAVLSQTLIFWNIGQYK